MNFLIGVALFLLVNSATSTDYCRPGLCRTGKHIGCGNTGRWGNSTMCGDNPRLMNLSEDDKQFILHLHNKNREEIASGSISRYTSAANMKEVTWNEELALVASFNAKTCVFAHDECRNTDNHPYSGQNLAIVGQSNGFKPFRDAYLDLHNKWFREYEFCDMKNIRKYQNKPTKANQQIGHFTQLVSDKMDQVGCSISMWEKDGMKFVYIVCNYSYTNMKDKAIYVEGKPSCQTFSQKYKYLCAN